VFGQAPSTAELAIWSAFGAGRGGEEEEKEEEGAAPLKSRDPHLAGGEKTHFGARHPLQYGYGSIPINNIFRGMNIHLPAILMFTRGTRF